MSQPIDRLTLFRRGELVMRDFCKSNNLPTPGVVVTLDRADWKVNACAYYRRPHIRICVAACALIGTAGRQWSYPGYTVDRTPYGVVQHELGHHVDVCSGHHHGPYWSEFSAALRGQSGEKPITSYAPNDAEWFAEMFRVYVTNPDLLKLVRPRTHRELAAKFKPVFEDTWRDRMRDAPARTIAAAERHIEAAR